MSNQSFGRVVKLRVYATVLGQVSSIPVISYNQGYTEFSSVQPSGDPGFRIRGKCVLVQPTVGFNTNQINLSIYNLGPDSRAILQSKVGTKIEIFAGYGLSPKQIALGDILWARTHKQNSDYITDVIAGDSHFALTSGEINISFSGPTTYAQAINACLNALEQNQIFRGQIDIPSGGWNQGMVLNGSPMVILSDICRKIGRSFNVIGGGAYILPLGQDTGAPLIEVSTDTGMIGIPEIQPPGIIGVQAAGVPVSPDNDVAFTHLLRSEFTLSQRVRIKSKFVNGDYVIGRVEQDFDSWSGPFYSRCQAFKVLTNVQ